MLSKLFKRIIESRIGRFAISSAGISAIYFVLLLILTVGGGIDNGTAYWICQGVSLCMHFFTQKIFVFKDKSRKHIIQKVVYHTLVSALFAWSSDYVGDHTSIGGPEWHGVTIAILLALPKFTFGYIAGYLIFGKEKNDGTATV